ncbi:MAG: hypothetical protein KIT72_16665 [Polyangiaceae bacterium]|nr:hypothetical protein [Polyangiaceae bacterium]MCW5792051.1 hypothetical protein [Polyangiaceae bacterium]
MPVERVSIDDVPRTHESSTIEERLSAMTLICRAAWLASGRPWPPEGRAHRSSMPGEVYRTDYE